MKVKIKVYYMDKSFFLKHKQKVFKLPLRDLIDFSSLVDELDEKKSTLVQEVDWSNTRKLPRKYVNPVILDKFEDKSICRKYDIKKETFELIDRIVR